MKKLMIAMACIAMTASMAMAQTDAKKCDKECAKTEQCAKQKCNKPCDKACDKQKCNKPCDMQRACEFEGLNLTDAQKAQIKAIKDENRATRQAARQAKQAQKAEKRDARQNERKAYLAKVKAVLTPEQYVKYLENAVTRADKGTKSDMRRMEGRFERGKQRPMGDKAPRAVKATKIEQAAQKAEK